jgi:hypothetical protein
MPSTGTYDLDVKRDRLTGRATSVAGSPNGALFELLNSSGRRPCDGPALDPDEIRAAPRRTETSTKALGKCRGTNLSSIAQSSVAAAGARRSPSMTDNRGGLASGGSGGCLAPARRTARAVVTTVALHATAQVNGATPDGY